MLRALLTVVLWQHVVAPLLMPPLVRWLHVERWGTRDPVVAATSHMQYAESERSIRYRAECTDHPEWQQPTEPIEYSTSILGLINGGLWYFDLVAVLLFTEGLNPVPSPPYIEVRKRWW